MELQVRQVQSEPQQVDAVTPHEAGSLGKGAQVALTATRKCGTIVLLVVLIVVFSATTSDFLTLSNFQSVLIVQAVTACMTFGVMFPLIVGEFDLSVGYMIGFVSMFGAWLGGKGWTAVPIILAMLAAGAFFGLVNAVLIERAKISSFIATLGVGIVLEGFTQGLSGGSVLTNNIPAAFATIGRSYAGPLALSVWITIVLAAILFYVLEHTPFGRSLYAIGGSQRVAFLAGLRTRRLKTMAFALSGTLVAIGAIFALGQNGSASPSFGPDLLLPAYAAAFLGVTTFRGGYYNVVGSVVGILVLAIGFNGLSLLGVPFWVQPIFNGGVLIVAVLAARAEARSVRVGS
jgi:ribose transport system permease protein